MDERIYLNQLAAVATRCRSLADGASRGCITSDVDKMEKLNNVRKVESAEGICDGVYVGRWSGRNVVFETLNGKYQAEVTNALLGTNILCSVTVENGVATVKAGG